MKFDRQITRADIRKQKQDIKSELRKTHNGRLAIRNFDGMNLNEFRKRVCEKIDNPFEKRDAKIHAEKISSHVEERKHKAGYKVFKALNDAVKKFIPQKSIA